MLKEVENRSSPEKQWEARSMPTTHQNSNLRCTDANNRMKYMQKKYAFSYTADCPA